MTVYQSLWFFFYQSCDNWCFIQKRNFKRKLIYMNFRFVWENKQLAVAKKNLKIWNSEHGFLRFPYALLGLAVKFWLQFVITLASVINKFKNFLLLQLLSLHQIHQSLGCVSTPKVCTTNAISQMTQLKKLLHITPFFWRREEKEEEERLFFSHIISMCWLTLAEYKWGVAEN